MGTNFSFEDFKDLSNLRIFQNLEIKWEIYSDFKTGSTPKIFAGNYDLTSVKPQTREQKVDLKSNILPNVFNPYPLLEIKTKLNEQAFYLPSHRFLSVSMSGNQLYIQFMPHGNHPIENLPIQEQCAWGVAYIEGELHLLTQLHTFLNKILIYKNIDPHPRCELCQGLLGIEQLALDISEDNFTDEAMVCNDCINVCAGYISKIEKIWDTYTEKKELPDPSDLKNWGDAGLTLSEGQNNENLEIYFKINQAIAMIFLEDIEEKTTVISTYINEISSYVDKYPNKDLFEANKVLNQLYEENKERIFKEKEKEEDKEDGEEIDLDEDFLVDEAIAKIQESKECQSNKEYQRAIDLIYEASDPLVEAGVWGEKEIILAQEQVASLREQMQNHLAPPSDSIESPQIKSESEVKAPSDIVEAKNALNHPTVTPLDKIELPKIKFAPIQIPKLGSQTEIKQSNSKKLNFIIPDDIPLDEDAEAFADALQFEPSETDMENHAKKSEEIPSVVEPKIELNKLSFDLPDEIPMDEDAEAFANALQFEPSEKDMENHAKKSEESTPVVEPKIELNKLSFDLPDEIPMDEDAEAFADALQFEPSELDMENHAIRREESKTSTKITPDVEFEDQLNNFALDLQNNNPIDEDSEPTVITEGLNPPIINNTPVSSVLKEMKNAPQPDSPTTKIPVFLPKTKKLDPEPKTDLQDRPKIEIKNEKEESLFSLLTTDKAANEPEKEKSTNIFEEHVKSDLFFGTTRKEKTEDYQERRITEKTEKIYDLFTKEALEKSVRKKRTKKSEDPSLNDEDKEEENTKNKKLARVVERRKALQKVRNKRVEICPMCGKIASKCTCGYMK